MVKKKKTLVLHYLYRRMYLNKTARVKFSIRNLINS